jgi:hypothetical protein
MSAQDYPDITDESGFEPLFDGRTLDGWEIIPRVYGDVYPGGPSLASVIEERGITVPSNPELHPPRWDVEDGTLVGAQGTTGYGGYLLSADSFGDFDLVLEMRPDWPADTGVMLRRRADDWAGFQVLVDHRPSGGIGGFFGNGLASFSALPFAVDAVLDADGIAIGIRPDDPKTSTEVVTPEKRARLAYAADVEDFIDVWRWSEWNELRIRCVGGPLPVISTWVNGLKIAELDTATLDAPDYDPGAVARHLGESGRIALEVHDNDEMFGEARWGRGAVCRWRNLRIRQYAQRAEDV